MWRRLRSPRRPAAGVWIIRLRHRARASSFHLNRDGTAGVELSSELAGTSWRVQVSFGPGCYAVHLDSATGPRDSRVRVGKAPSGTAGAPLAAGGRWCAVDEWSPARVLVEPLDPDDDDGFLMKS